MASLPKKPVSHLLTKIHTSGINISPDALQKLQDLSITSQDLETFIQKISFAPNFNSHITMEWIQKELPAITNKESDIDQIEDLNLRENDVLIQKSSSNPPEESYYDNDNSVLTLNPEEPSQNDEFFEFDDEYIPEPPDSPDFPEIQESNSPFHSEKEKSSQIINTEINPSHTFDIKNQIINQDENSEEISHESFYESENDSLMPNQAEMSAEEIESAKNNQEIAQIRAEKQKNWERILFNSGTSTFKPLAADYDSDIKIIQDPTGHLYTEGKLEEFIELTNDKFEKLKNILKKRPSAGDVYDINMINRLENSVEVSFIGMVQEKRQTSNRNYIITFEDPTGICTVLVRGEQVELYNQMIHLLQDQVVLVEGYLSVQPKKKSRIIIANNIYFPDTPSGRKTKGTKEDLAICFISDTHFGSKDWLGKVWNRFVKYLNCEIGSENQMKQAGKIKYLCIAGDIVDGIGIFPNQDKRLSIPDIYDQYSACAQYLAEIPEHIEIILSPGDHDAVRKAIPTPALDKEFTESLYADPRITMVGCPALIDLHGITVEMFHGTSLIDLNMSIPGMTNEDPVKTMREFFLGRHLAPTFGKKTEIAPLPKDWLVMNQIPDILHTGHLHKNGCGWYHGSLLINSGCFQGQTQFMDNLGIEPDYGKPTLVFTKDKLTPQVIDLIGE